MAFRLNITTQSRFTFASSLIPPCNLRTSLLGGRKKQGLVFYKRQTSLKKKLFVCSSNEDDDRSHGDVVKRQLQNNEALLTSDSGHSIIIGQDPVVIGSGDEADVVIKSNNVLSEHAKLEWKSGQLMLTALGGDPDDLESESYTFMNENSLRSGVAYLVNSGSILHFGTDDVKWKVECKDSSNVNHFTESLLQTMVSGFSEEGKRTFKNMTGM